MVPLYFWKIMFLFTLTLHLSTDFMRSTTRKSVTQIPATDSLMTLTRPFVTTTPAGMNCSTLWLGATRAMRVSATHEPSASSSSSLSWPIWLSPSHGSEVFVLHLSPHLYPGLSGRHQAMEVVFVLHLSPHLYPGLSGRHQAMEVKSSSSTCLLIFILAYLAVTKPWKWSLCPPPVSSSLSWPIWPSPSHGSEVFVLHLSPHLYPGLSGRHQAMEVKSLSSTCLLIFILAYLAVTKPWKWSLCPPAVSSW